MGCGRRPRRERFARQESGDFVVLAGERHRVESVDPESRTISIETTSASLAMRIVYVCDAPEPAPSPDEPASTEGAASIEVGGRTYACHWIETRVPTPASGTRPMAPGETVTRTWYSPEVPAVGLLGHPEHGGVVRIETRAEGRTVVQELAEHGNAPGDGR